jgi:hypothetical protein
MTDSRFDFADFDSGFVEDASVMADRVGSSFGRKTATADAHWKVDYRIRIGLLWQQLPTGGPPEFVNLRINASSCVDRIRVGRYDLRVECLLSDVWREPCRVAVFRNLSH